MLHVKRIIVFLDQQSIAAEPELVIETRRKQYNTEMPHGALGNRTPLEFIEWFCLKSTETKKKVLTFSLVLIWVQVTGHETSLANCLVGMVLFPKSSSSKEE